MQWFDYKHRIIIIIITRMYFIVIDISAQMTGAMAVPVQGILLLSRNPAHSRTGTL